MHRIPLLLTLLLLACSTTEEPEDAADPTDSAADDTEDTDETDTGEDDAGSDTDSGAEDTGGADTGGADTGGSDTGGSDTGGSDTAGDSGTDPGPDGGALFASTCASCHGADGGGTGDGPDIVGEMGRSDSSLLDIIQNGKSDMPGQDVTAAEAQAIIDWMRANF